MPVHRIGRVVSIPANGSVARITLSLRSYLQAKRLLQAEQFDLIHLHEPMMPALPLTVLRHSGATNIGTFHAFRNTPLAYFYGKPILQPFFRKLHGHITVSNAAREFVGEYFPADYRIIPNGIDFPRFNTRYPPLEELADGRPTVLFVGRLEKRKGLRFLLRAWPMVLKRQPEARLVVVGRGRPLEGYKRFAARQGWAPTDVVFAGYVSAEDLPRYYQACDVFCAPNTGQESFGIVLLEAMAAGAPIVASDIPGYRDVVTDWRGGHCWSSARTRGRWPTGCAACSAVPSCAPACGATGQIKARDTTGRVWLRSVLDVLRGGARAARDRARAAASPLRARQAHGGHAHARVTGKSRSASRKSQLARA